MGCTSSTPVVEPPSKRPQTLPPPTAPASNSPPPVVTQPAPKPPTSSSANSNPTSSSNNAVSSSNKENKIPSTTNTKTSEEPKATSPTPSNNSARSLSVEVPASQPQHQPQQSKPQPVSSTVPAIVNALKSPYDSDNEDFQAPLTTSVDDSPMAVRSAITKTNSTITQLDFEQFLSHPKIEAILQIKMTTEEKLCDYYLTTDEDNDGYINETDVEKIIEQVQKDHREEMIAREQKKVRQSLTGNSLPTPTNNNNPKGNGTPGKRLVYKGDQRGEGNNDADADVEGFATPSSVKPATASPHYTGSSPQYINNMTDITLDSAYSTPHRPPMTPMQSNSPTTPFTADRLPVSPTPHTDNHTSPTNSPGKASNSPFHRQRKPMTVKKFISPITPGEGPGAGLEDISVDLEGTLSQSLFSPAATASNKTATALPSPPPPPPSLPTANTDSHTTNTITNQADESTLQARKRLRASMTNGTPFLPPSKKGFLICSPNKTRGYHVLEGGTLYAMDGMGGPAPGASKTGGQVGIERKGISLQGRQILAQEEKGIQLTAPFYANLNYSTGESISLDLIADNLDPVLLLARNTQDRDEWMEALQQHLEYITAVVSQPGGNTSILA